MSEGSKLSEDQKRRIEENRKKALALKALKKNTNCGTCTSHLSLQNDNLKVPNVSSLPTSTIHHTSITPNTTFTNKNEKNSLMSQSKNNFQSHNNTSQNLNAFNNHVANKMTEGSVLPPGTTKTSIYSPKNSNSSVYNQCGKSNNTVSYNKPTNQRKESSLVSAVTETSPGNPITALVKGKCVLISTTRFLIEIGFHSGVIAVFKTMSTRQYDLQTKKWSFDLREYKQLLQKISGLGRDVYIEALPRCVLSAFNQYIVKGQLPADLSEKPDVDLSRVDQILVSALMPFQKQGVNFAISNKGRILIADDMGLGKTLQALCIAAYYKEEWPLLIVVPSSVRFTWREQILKWLPSVFPQDINVMVTGKDRATSGLINIISYDLMVKVKRELHDESFRIIILDESHSLKNSKTARFQAVQPILKRANRVIMLSGTPALSRPAELFTQISSIDSTIFPKFHDFGIRYCDGKQNAWGWDFSGSSNLAELQLILERKIMIRRLKKDVMEQLPSKCRQMVILDPNSVKINKDMKTAHSMVDKLKGSDRRGALLEYFNETGSAKMKAVSEYVLEILEGGRKLLVFAHHQVVLNAVEISVRKKGYASIRIDGRTSSEQRNHLVQQFQKDDDIKVAILSITAANAGINLTAATLVIFAELFWNPGILMQAEDRAHRIGQKDSVTVHYLVAPGTADDYIWPLVQQKLDVLGKAGLSKDNFSEADTKRLSDPKQKEILDFFQQSFFEEDDAVLNELVNCDDNCDNVSISASSLSKPSMDQQSKLFQYFKSEKSNSKLGDLKDSTGHDWLDDINADWEDDAEAPWPPQPKKSKVS